MTALSQLCQESKHEQRPEGLQVRARHTDECGGWAWYLPGQQIGPECECPCHAIKAAQMRLDSLAWVNAGGSNSALSQQ
jgi:hypothetical protein